MSLEEKALRHMERAIKERDEQITALETLLEASGKRREKVEARIEQLEEALKFYANEEVWKHNLVSSSISAGWQPVVTKRYCRVLDGDEGRRARAALSREPSEAPEKEGENG